MLDKLVAEFSLGKEERRTDANAKGKTFTKGEFIAYYGAKEGEKKWADAGKKGGSKPAPKKERNIVKE